MKLNKMFNIEIMVECGQQKFYWWLAGQKKEMEELPFYYVTLHEVNREHLEILTDKCTNEERHVKIMLILFIMFLTFCLNL